MSGQKIFTWSIARLFWTGLILWARVGARLRLATLIWRAWAWPGGDRSWTVITRIWGRLLEIEWHQIIYLLHRIFIFVSGSGQRIISLSSFLSILYKCLLKKATYVLVEKVSIFKVRITWSLRQNKTGFRPISWSLKDCSLNWVNVVVITKKKWDLSKRLHSFIHSFIHSR